MGFHITLFLRAKKNSEQRNIIILFLWQKFCRKTTTFLIETIYFLILGKTNFFSKTTKLYVTFFRAKRQHFYLILGKTKHFFKEKPKGQNANSCIWIKLLFDLGQNKKKYYFIIWENRAYRMCFSFWGFPRGDWNAP